MNSGPLMARTLVNAAGQLVGIPSQILTPSDGNIGLGFAIPSNMAKHVMDQLIETGTVRRGKLGVTVQRITPDLAASMGLSNTRGALIGGVEPSEELNQELRNHVAKEIGALARPDVIRFTDSLPKTRSGKIMRRFLRDIASGKESTGDATTLEDLSVLAKLRESDEG